MFEVVLFIFHDLLFVDIINRVVKLLIKKSLRAYELFLFIISLYSCNLLKHLMAIQFAVYLFKDNQLDKQTLCNC